uniref:Uncharacterized protein n=1 Tax=Trichuris muris TaxID=70415 RepID=A0A5S6Q1A9_TRIMR
MRVRYLSIRYLHSSPAVLWGTLVEAVRSKARVDLSCYLRCKKRFVRGTVFNVDRGTAKATLLFLNFRSVNGSKTPIRLLFGRTLCSSTLVTPSRSSTIGFVAVAV